MYLHRMVVCGIGPFPDEHEIDLARVGATGLFLLEGPTGAGKSTLIDAIVFALYSQVASAEASGDRMRSRHCPPDRESYVDLVFETPSGVYRVRRTPAYERAARRGTGTTRQNSTVTLWRLASPDRPDDGDVVSTRAEEVGRIVRRAVGLDREQFVQTIVLPQGEFSRFLRAKPEDRTALLQKVFGTARYERVQTILGQLRAEAKARVGAAGDELRLAVAAFRAVVGPAGAEGLAGAGAGEDGPAEASDADGEGPSDEVEVADSGARPLDGDDPGDGGGGAEVDADARRSAGFAHPADVSGDEIEVALATALGTGPAPDGTGLRRLVGAVAAHAATEAERLAAAHAEAVVARGRAVTDHEAGAARGRAFERRRALRTRLAELEERAEAHRDREARLAAGRRARVVAELVRGAVAARERVAAAAREAEAAARDLPEPRGAADPAGLLAVLAAERDAATTARAALEHHVEVEAGLAARRAAAVEAETAQAARRERLAALAADLGERLPRARSELTTELAEATAAAERLPAARAAGTAADARLRAAREVAELTEQVATRREAAEAALRRAETTAAEAAARRRARIAGIAAELAVGLRPGEPCAVCGATEHPAPATRAEGHVGAEQVEEAERASAVAADEAQRLSLEHAALRERLDRAVAAADGDLATATAAAHAATADVVAAEAAVARRAELTALREELDAEITELTTERVGLEKAVAEADARAGVLAAELARDEKAVRAAAGDAASVRERCEELDARLGRLTRRLRAVEELVTARERAAERTAEVSAALAREGFADEAAAGAAALSEAEERELDRAVTAHTGALAEVRTGLAEPEIADLPEEEDVDLPALESRREAAIAAESAAAEAAGRARDRERAVTSAASGVVAAEEALTATRARAAPAVRMGNLAAASTGDNALRVTLSTYVLMRRFQDVVASANERLHAMSSGRYALQHSVAREDTRALKTGLALQVVDHEAREAGGARDPRTLSGGETFYVSLCLALGLADVVTGEAGGIELGTLFIDEGFGTLDPETLDRVLTELGKLRDRGRVIGVVSHVDVLKQAIGEQIRVRRRADGASTLEVVA